MFKFITDKQASLEQEKAKNELVKYLSNQNKFQTLW